MKQRSSAYKLFVLLGILSVSGAVLLSSVVGYLSPSVVVAPDSSPMIKSKPVMDGNGMCFQLPPIAVGHCDGLNIVYNYTPQVVCADAGQGRITSLPDLIEIHFNDTDTWGPPVVVETTSGQQTFMPNYHADNSKLNCTLNTTITNDTH